MHAQQSSIVTEPFLLSEGREGLDKDDTMRNIKSANEKPKEAN